MAHRDRLVPHGFVLLALLCLAPANARGDTPTPTAPAPDPLLRALGDAGVAPADLGFRPDGAWLRYPIPQAIPYRSRIFDDLFAHPAEIYPTMRMLAVATQRFLPPAALRKDEGSLFRLCYYLGWELQQGGFRDYQAGLNEKVPERDPFLFALERLYQEEGKSLDLWSNDQPADWPRPREQARAAIAKLDPALQRILGQAILDLADARRWHRLAFRRVDEKEVQRLWDVRDLGATQTDGMIYYPEIDDVARDLDLASLTTSSRKTVWAASRLLRSTQAWVDSLHPDLKDVHLDLMTPAGRIEVSGSGDDEHVHPDCLCLLDLGGDDVYRGSVGASASRALGVSIAVDLSGNDRYLSPDPDALTQGSGFFGTGVLIDASGDDVYEAGRCSQGFGFFGTGVLIDLAGNDRYRLATSGQGAGYFGVGILGDAAGDDTYKIDGDGQGFAGPAGVGTLADAAGNDSYYAEPRSAVVARPDSHSEGKINCSNAQGAGLGRRGDLTDGHSWAGGVGSLIDLAGNDSYVSGNWSAGCGYWYGVGFLYDGGGDDVYRASCFSIAAAAHFAVAALVDEGGNDRYVGDYDPHTGMGFGHDFTVVLLYDRSGDDFYSWGREGLGEAINMSQVFFIDAAGNDTYRLQKGAGGMGAVPVDPSDVVPVLERNYHRRALEVALLLDGGGKDRYLRYDPKSGAESPDSLRADGVNWIGPRDPALFGTGRYREIARDLPGDSIRVGWFVPQVR